MDSLVARIRAAIEEILPWYDPSADAAADHRVQRKVQRAEVIARRVRESALIHAQYLRDDARLASRDR